MKLHLTPRTQHRAGERGGCRMGSGLLIVANLGTGPTHLQPVLLQWLGEGFFLRTSFLTEEGMLWNTELHVAGA
jgi:hypothetical protein